MFTIKRRLKKPSGFRRKCVMIGALAFIVAAGALTSGLAQDPLEILPIPPVPGHDISGPVYHRIGVLDRIGDGEIVVNDILYKFTTGEDGRLTFRSETHQNEISLSYFKVGQRVGCVMDGVGDVRELWLLKDQRR